MLARVGTKGRQSPPLTRILESSGIAHSSLKKHHQVCSARVRRHTVFDSLKPLAEHSADVLVQPCRQTPARCGFFRSHPLVICAANLDTRQPLHMSIGVSSPRVCPPPAQVSRPRCTRHERCSLRCASAASSWPAPKARRASCKLANGRPPSKTAWSHFAASRTRSSTHADADE